MGLEELDGGSGGVNLGLLVNRVGLIATDVESMAHPEVHVDLVGNVVFDVNLLGGLDRSRIRELGVSLGADEQGGHLDALEYLWDLKARRVGHGEEIQLAITGSQGGVAGSPAESNAGNLPDRSSGPEGVEELLSEREGLGVTIAADERPNNFLHGILGGRKGAEFNGVAGHEIRDVDCDAGARGVRVGHQLAVAKLVSKDVREDDNGLVLLALAAAISPLGHVDVNVSKRLVGPGWGSREEESCPAALGQDLIRGRLGNKLSHGVRCLLLAAAG